MPIRISFMSGGGGALGFGFESVPPIMYCVRFVCLNLLLYLF
jgi:hypothetical protein